MAGGKLELLPVAAADAELVDAAIAQQVVAAAQHAGVAELGPEIILPQIGVGVKVDDVQLGIPRRHRPHRPQRDQVLAAQQQRQLAVPQDLRRPGFNVDEGALAAAEAEFQVAAVKDLAVGQVGVLVGAVGLDAVALMPDGRRAEPGPRPVAGGGIVGGAVQHDLGAAVGAVAPDKGFNIAWQHQRSSTSSSISSRNAGR